MSQYEKIRAAVVAHFRTNWPAAASSAGCQIALASIQMDNHKFTQPVGTPWGRLSFAWGDRASVAVGGANLRTTGFLYLQVFLPLETGTQEGYQACDALAGVFDLRSIAVTGTANYCVFETARQDNVGDRDGYRQINASIPFRVDEIN